MIAMAPPRTVRRTTAGCAWGPKAPPERQHSLDPWQKGKRKLRLDRIQQTRPPPVPRRQRQGIGRNHRQKSTHPIRLQPAQEAQQQQPRHRRPDKGKKPASA